MTFHMAASVMALKAIVLLVVAYARLLQAQRVIRSGSDFAAVVADPDATTAVLAADIRLLESDWSGYATPIRLTRNLTIIGVAGPLARPGAPPVVAGPRPVMDMMHLQGKITLGPLVVLNFTRVVVMNSYAGNFYLGSNLEILTTSPASDRTTVVGYDSVMLMAVCYPPHIMLLAAGPEIIRPDWLPGTQSISVLPNPPDCVATSQDDITGGGLGGGAADVSAATAPVVPYEKRCWAQMGFLENLACVSAVLNPMQRQEFQGYGILMVNLTYLCAEELTDECISQLGLVGCMAAHQRSAEAPEPSLQASQRQPPGLLASEPPPARLPSTTAGAGGRGVPLGAAVGGACGGGLALAACLAAALVVVRRRRRLHDREQQGDEGKAPTAGSPSGNKEEELGHGGKGRTKARDVQSRGSSATSGVARADASKTSTVRCDWHRDRVASKRAADSSSLQFSASGSVDTPAAAWRGAGGPSFVLSPNTPHRFDLRLLVDPPTTPETPSLPSPSSPDLEAGTEAGAEAGTGAGAGAGPELELLPVVLGKGGFGRVVEGRYRGHPVAVKVADWTGAGVWGLPDACRCADGGDGGAAAASGGADAEGRFASAPVDDGPQGPQRLARELGAEVEVLGRCCHPNIVTLHAACLTPPRLCLVMERMDTSLDKLIYGAGPGHLIPLDEVVSIALDVARGLEYLHPTVVHRDLKPANVLVNHPGTPRQVAKLSDFGLSRLRSTIANWTADPEAGTPEYMAPELFNVDNNFVTHKVDVYAFGVLLWAMLSGQRPWEGLQMVVVAYRVYMLEARPPLEAIAPERLPPKLARLMYQCWEAQPERRPAAAELVKELLLLREQEQVMKQLSRAESSAFESSATQVS